MKPSLTVLISAYKCGPVLRDTYETTLRALSAAGISDYEILLMTVVNPDKSPNDTPSVAGRIAEEDPRVRHLHTPFYAGLGFQYREGFHAATKDYVMTVPSHNLTEESSLVNIMRHIGQTDAIFTYTENPESRPAKVRFVSRGYVALCNILFGMNMRYYNGIMVMRRDLLLRFPLMADDHACMAEVVIHAVKSGARFIEIPQVLKMNTARTGRGWSIKGALRVAGTLGALFWNIQVKGRRALKYDYIA